MATTDTLIINRLLSTAAERKASDMHFVAGSYPALRTSGKLTMLEDEEISTPDFIKQMIDFLLSETEQEQLQKDKQITTVYEWLNQMRLKVKIFFQKGMPVISLHLIPEMIPELSSLGLPQGVVNIVNLKKGIVLIGGSFGSGRSTTAAAILNEINNQRSEKILTIEDNIEFILVNNKSIISQQAVGKDVTTVLGGLKQALDQDFNVLLVNGLTTHEEWSLVMRHAEAGLLFLVIMTTETTTLALERIISSYPDDKGDWIRELLANNLESALIQRLLPRVGGGLALACELMLMDQAIASSIKENKLYQIFSILQSNRDNGMLALDNSLIDLVRTGEVTKGDALPEVIDKVNFENSLKKF